MLERFASKSARRGEALHDRLLFHDPITTLALIEALTDVRRATCQRLVDLRYHGPFSEGATAVTRRQTMGHVGVGGRKVYRGTLLHSNNGEGQAQGGGLLRDPRAQLRKLVLQDKSCSS